MSSQNDAKPPGQNATAPENPGLSQDKRARREALFCEAYCCHLNGARAAREAGFSHKSAARIAHRLLKRPSVKAAIEKKIQATNREWADLKFQAISILAAIMTADPADVHDNAGELRDLSEIDISARQAIQEISVKEWDSGSSRRARLANKVPAIHLLGKLLGWFEQDDESEREAREVANAGESLNNRLSDLRARLAGRVSSPVHRGGARAAQSS